MLDLNNEEGKKRGGEKSEKKLQGKQKGKAKAKTRNTEGGGELRLKLSMWGAGLLRGKKGLLS